MKRFLPILLSAIILLVSCAPKPEKSIDIALSSEPVTLDVMVNTALVGRLVAVGNVYEKLLVLDGDGNVRPELCSSYSFSDDGRTVVFIPRSGVKFHDGTTMTARDIVSSMNRWLDVYAQARNLVGEGRFTETPEGNVAISSSTSLAMLPYMIAASPQCAVVMPSPIADKGGDPVDEYVGTGPYKVSSWKSGEVIELRKFTDYVGYGEASNGVWGVKKAPVALLRYYFVSDSVTRLLGLESGLYDAMNDVMSDDRARISASPRMELLDGGESGLIALIFNKREGIFTSLGKRRAASLAFDPEELMRSCYGDYGYAIHSDYMEVEQTLWSAVGENPYGSMDRDGASRLGAGGEVRILTSNLSNMDKIALAAKENLESVGFTVQVDVSDWATMMEKRKDPSSWDICISAFSQVPIPQLKSFLNPEFPGWVDEEGEGMDKLRASASARTMEEAFLLWQEAQTAFWDEVPVYVPGHYSTSYAVSSSLRGVVVQNGFFFWNADLD